MCVCERERERERERESVSERKESESDKSRTESSELLHFFFEKSSNQRKMHFAGFFPSFVSIVSF